jgi:hypothetical protein
VTHRPLGRIGLHQVSALWWLGLLYRRPRCFRMALEHMHPWAAIRSGVGIVVHVTPYVLGIHLAALWVSHLIFGISDAPLSSGWVTQSRLGFALVVLFLFLALGEGLFLAIFHAIFDRLARGKAFRIARVISFGIGSGIIVAVAAACILAIAFGIAGEAALWIEFWIAQGIAQEIAIGIAVGIALGVVVASDNGFDGRPAGPIIIGIAVWITVWIAVGIGHGIAFGSVCGIATTVGAGRFYYELPYLFLSWPTPLGHLYRYHPVAWDDLCAVPFPHLDRLLVAYADHAPDAAGREIERLISSYPSQRMSALRARVRLLARDAAAASDLGTLDTFAWRLPDGSRGFLQDVPKVRAAMMEIAAQQRELDLADRAVFRAPLAHLLHTQIENASHQFAGLREPLASCFRDAARHWLVLAERQWNDARAVIEREPTPQLFRPGDPVDIGTEAFIPRQPVVETIAAQLLLATGCPGLVLYGRRRTGKTSILRTLQHFLPRDTHVAVLSAQDPQVFTSDAYCAGAVAKAVSQAWPGTTPDEDTIELPRLFRTLADANNRLTAENRRLLIAIDEYGAIDQYIGAKTLSEALLATIRESIQTHRRIVWMFAGSHEIAELTHAAWTSYLISARTIEVPLFTLAETTALLTEPLRYSPLWAKDDPKRPMYPAALWGENGIARIHAETAGWPHLVQLVAATVVNLLNQGTQGNADDALLERALDVAVDEGRNVLRELMVVESRIPGEWDYLRGFRAHDTQPPPGDEAVHRSLRGRLLVVEESGVWRLRVPLMQRWLRATG